MDITNDRRGEKKAKHTFGMQLRKETEPVKLSDVRSAGCSPEQQCHPCNGLACWRQNRTPVGLRVTPAPLANRWKTAPAGRQLQPGAPEGTSPVGRYSCGKTAACPTLLKPTRHTVQDPTRVT